MCPEFTSSELGNSQWLEPWCQSLYAAMIEEAVHGGSAHSCGKLLTKRTKQFATDCWRIPMRLHGIGLGSTVSGVATTTGACAVAVLAQYAGFMPCMPTVNAHMPRPGCHGVAMLTTAQTTGCAKQCSGLAFIPSLNSCSGCEFNGWSPITAAKAPLLKPAAQMCPGKYTPPQLPDVAQCAGPAAVTHSLGLCANSLTEITANCPDGDPDDGQFTPTTCPAQCAQLFTPWWLQCEGGTVVKALPSIMQTQLGEFAKQCEPANGKGECQNPVAVPSGTWSAAGAAGYTVGSTTAITCQQGYTAFPDTSSTMTCDSNLIWVFTGNYVQCIAGSTVKKCSAPPVVANGVWENPFGLTSFTVGSTVSLDCNPGFTEKPAGAALQCGSSFGVDQWTGAGLTAVCVDGGEIDHKSGEIETENGDAIGVVEAHTTVGSGTPSLRC
jgi:hypothetical protein